ncbi:succinylglutamate desuccinylase [Pantoea sp. ICBG 1758]|uniref:succinylglutamate desuccinylase n=1 Tax=Pantoea sp. ICBG 1758 TaxID=2071682 RepID=UPI000CE44CA9|nr:succinylglutamate desuccinylase [Pantoea sp. ICBG 1758]PPC63721.1 succinylglutamate desuccinylase [Pantoea sp. ICBG 1758]
MRSFLQQTLAGTPPAVTQGETAYLRWQWQAEGILSLTPLTHCDRALVLSAGIHGNETAPVEIVEQLLAPLLSGEKPLAVRLLVILGNPAALRSGRRYQQYDLNRLFGGRWQRVSETSEAQRALQLEQVMERFWRSCHRQTSRWHLDLHTAIRGSYYPRFAVMPANARPWPDTFMQWLAAAELEALVFHRAPGGTFTHYSCEHHHAASSTLELGKALPFGENDLTQFRAVQRALAALLEGETWPQPHTQPRRYHVSQQITRQGEGFTLHMSADTLNFTAFPQGTLLAEEGDTRYYVQQAREYVLFPNPQVAPGLRAGLMLTEENAQMPAH